MFLHFCGVWPGELVSSLQLSAFPHIFPKKTRSFIPPAQGLSPSPLETQALSKGPSRLPSLVLRALIPRRLQRATSRSWCFGLSYTQQHNQARQKLLHDGESSFGGAARARAPEQTQPGLLSLQCCLWADWLCELKGSFMVFDTFTGDFQA